MLATMCRDSIFVATSVPATRSAKTFEIACEPCRGLRFSCPNLPHADRACAHASADGGACWRWLCRSATPVAIGNGEFVVRGLSQLRSSRTSCHGGVPYTRTLVVRVMFMASTVTVLVVEDDEAMQRQLQQTLRARYKVLTASCWTQARQIRERTDVDVVVADVNLATRDRTGVDGWCAATEDTPIVLVASRSRAGETTVAAGTRRPLLAFPAYPVELGELSRTLEDAIAERRVAREPTRASSVGDELTGILAESRAMRAVMELIDRAALCATPILLVGESGTGKELLARALHKKSPRAHGPFLAINCSAIPESLLENELFGHRRGAFTDARDDQRGLFQSAQHGTIFLDEIGDMVPALQGKLLRVLQEKEVHPLGAPAPVPTDVRIVTATHRDLPALVAEGRFREDLLYRVNVIEVRVPPLRERPDDLEPLVRHFLGKLGARIGKPDYSVSEEVMDVLRRHPWPGNVRELENVIERALVLGAGPLITLEDLPDSVRARPSRSGRVGGRRLADVEREHIIRTLRAVAGNKAAAARVLGLDRKTLYRKLTQHRIPVR
jgi:DNA-binding NtrC family response regulator